MGSSWIGRNVQLHVEVEVINTVFPQRTLTSAVITLTQHFSNTYYATLILRTVRYDCKQKSSKLIRAPEIHKLPLHKSYQLRIEPSSFTQSCSFPPAQTPACTFTRLDQYLQRAEYINTEEYIHAIKPLVSLMIHDRYSDR